MWKWIREIIKSDNEVTDYDFFIETLRNAGISEKKIELLESRYITAKNAKTNVIDKLK